VVMVVRPQAASNSSSLRYGLQGMMIFKLLITGHTHLQTAVGTGAEARQMECQLRTWKHIQCTECILRSMEVFAYVLPCTCSMPSHC
jgi:hypothetical protein